MKKEHYVKEVLRILLEKTGNYQFKDLIKEATDDPLPDSNAATRVLQVKKLIHNIIYIAGQKYYQTHDYSGVTYTKDDWEQEAMIILCNEVLEKYDPEKTKYFDVYAKTCVKQRLTDIQRTVFSKNPCTNEKLRRLAISKRREMKKQNRQIEPTIEELAHALSEDMGRSVDSIREFLESGAKQRLVAREDDTTPREDIKPGISPEAQYIRLETRKILWGCISKLNAGFKVVYVRHEFYNISFKKMHDSPVFRRMLDCDKDTLDAFKSRYRRWVFETVKSCVKSKYKF